MIFKKFQSLTKRQIPLTTHKIKLLLTSVYRFMLYISFTMCMREYTTVCIHYNLYQNLARTINWISQDRRKSNYQDSKKLIQIHNMFHNRIT